jgi:Ca2+-binding RTX toxin-like protein
VGAVFNLVGTDGVTDDTSFETANVKVSGAASVVFMGTGLAGLTTVNVTGATTGVTQGFFGTQQDFGLVLWQVTNFSNLAKVDASGMTGSGGLQILALGTTATGFTFTGSNSADYLFLGTTALNASGTLNGGGGKDILATNSFSTVSTAVNKAIGFEVLQALNPVSSLEANTYTTINEFLISGGPSGSRLNITGVESTDRFVFTNDQGSGDETVRFTAAAAGESVTFEMRADSGAGGEIAIVSNTNTGNDVGAIGFQNGVSSVTIDSTGQNSAANLIEAVDNGSFLYFAFKNEDGLANFKITGSQSLTIAAKEGVDFSNQKLTGFLNAANVDASGFTGVLRIAGSNLTDVIKGGNGNDIIYGLGGNDNLTGNGGSDQFRFVSETGGKDSIKDFAKGIDKIGISDGFFANTNGTQAGATLSAQDYVDNRQGITSIGASDANKVIELQTGLSTSQIQTDTGAAIAAFVLVFNTTTGKAELWFDDNWSDADRTQLATFENVVDLVGVQGFQNTDFVEFVA